MILLDKIRVPQYNVRIHDMATGIDDLAASIKGRGVAAAHYSVSGF